MPLSLFQLFSHSVEGFLSVRQTGFSVLSILRSRMALKRLCRVHPVLGPLYGLLLMGGCVWLLAKLCGAVLIRAYRYTMYVHNITYEECTVKGDLTKTNMHPFLMCEVLNCP